jgi:multiple sugar transport system permease protein
MFNSVFVTSVGTLGALVVASMAAYAFARIEFPGRDLLFMVFGASLLVPGILLLIPNFMLMRSLGWIDTYHALIWPGFAGFFGVFFLRQFFMSIPHELTEAAIIDGCSPFGIYWRVILPLAKPAMATLGIFSFLGIWNDFVWPLIVLNSNEMRTLPVGLAIFNGEYWSEQGIIMAGAVLTSIPVMLVYVIFQRQITKAVLVTGFGGR